MKSNKLLLAFAIFFSCGIFAQELFPPMDVITGTYKGLTIPLRDFQTINPNNYNPEEVILFPNMANISPEEKTTTTTVIQNLQTETGKIAAYGMEQNFVGFSANESGGYYPPDPTGAVGPNHYVHSVNSAVKIFDKTGSLLLGPVSLAAFLGNGSNSGDPIVLYDQLADRWIVSEFGAGTNTLSIGVSETNDPTGSFNVWDFVYPGGFPDYPHYATWHDGYYGTVNLIGTGGHTFVMERDVMLAGGANPEMVIFSLPGIRYNPVQVKSAEPANLLGTTIDPSMPGFITYLQDDAWSSVDFDHIKVWEIYMDWDNVNNSTVSEALEIPTEPFDAGEVFGNGNGAIHQPGTSQRLSGHGGIISYAANFRSFEDHNSWLITFNTFIDENETGGIRWIELRNDEVNPWEIFQEGTYSIADGHSRLMSSSAMDATGNIALAYTTASTSLAVSLRYTGRFDGDPLGQMTLDETVIINGPGVRTNSNRYGDYAHMTMDPNNFTFWYTSDYFSSNNFWRTRVASFSINGEFTDDVGVVDILEPNNGVLNNSEPVEVSIRNFGSDPQSNIPLELRLDGNLVASETYNGTINPNETATYTFSQTVNLSNAGDTYEIDVKTDLGGDEFIPNDDYTKEVTHLLGNNVGAIAIISPITGSSLTTDEEISVKIKNFGTSTQSNFNVQYSINGDSPIIENFAGPITSEETIVFNFAQTADLSELGVYNFSVSTSLSGDQNNADDEVTKVVENLLCQPAPDCSLGHGLQLFSVAEINNPSGCDGYADYTSQIANLEPGSTNDLTLTTGFGDQWVTVFIDFNDDNIFEIPGEIIINNFIIAEGEGAGTYTETIDLEIPNDAILGEHRMRVKTNWQAPVIDACENTDVGETEDYTANIGSLGVEDYEISNSNLIVTTLPNNQFEVILNTQYEGGVFLGVFNILGQEVGFNKRVPRINNSYKMSLDMSRMSGGVYFLRMGGHGTTTYKTARILVK